MEVKSNSENVKILNNKIENGKLIIDVEALNDKVISNESFEIKFKAKTESISEVIKVENLSVKDNKDRIFIASLSEAAIQLIEDKAPSIIAEDKTLTVGDKFDPMKDVKASDEEDGDISSNIKVKENNVDTTKAGEYKVVYSVEDSNKNITEKIVKITVKAKSDNTDNNNGKGNNDNLPETGGASPVGTVILGSIMAIAGIALRKFKK